MVCFFPSSLPFRNDGKFLHVTNCALDLRVIGLPQAVDSQWEARVLHFTVVRVSGRFDPWGGNVDHK